MIKRQSKRDLKVIWNKEMEIQRQKGKKRGKVGMGNNIHKSAKWDKNWKFQVNENIRGKKHLC